LSTSPQDADIDLAETPPRRRRWWPLSVRIFLVLLVVLGSWSGWLVLQAYRQHEFGQRIVAAGGIVEYNIEYDSSGKWVTNAPTFLATRLRRISGSNRFDLPTVVRFYAANRPEAHPDFARLLGPLSQARSISIDGYRVNSADLECLAQKSSLRALGLSEMPLADDDLETIQSLSLRWLSLHRTRVSDHGMRHLTQMQTLEYLDLTRTRVGDAGLEPLADLPNLRRLILNRCKVTRAGADALRLKLPKCQIQWEPLDPRR
jgi:hypothetical protein